MTRAHLRTLIPGGGTPYSKTRYPANAPLAVQGQGGQILGSDGRWYVDWAMGINNVLIGHAEPAIDDAAIAALRSGQALSGPSALEGELAEALLALYPEMTMVKFAKNGSDVNNAAVKLARAVTGRQLIAYDGSAPFLSTADWWVSGSLHPRGTLEIEQDYSRRFTYNDLGSVEALFAVPDEQPACVILEVCRDARPAPGFLPRMRELCTQHGTLLIFDEIVTGFRYGLGGAQALFGVTPDLLTLGKGIANGHAVSALLGRRAYMALGDIDRLGPDASVFLLSTTNGAEQSGLAAALATIQFYQQQDVCGRLTEIGQRLIGLLDTAARRHGLPEYVFTTGDFWNRPLMQYLNAEGQFDPAFRELFQQEMFEAGVWWAWWVCPCYRRTEAELVTTALALDAACRVYAQAIRAGSVDGYLRRVT